MFEELLRYDKNKTYCFFDFETFNLCLNFVQNRPWQLGIIKVKGDNIVESKDLIINWSKETDLKIGAEAAKITHYNHQRVLDTGLTPKEAWLAAEPYFNDCDFIIGHNILNFDAYLVKGYAEYLNRPWKHYIPKMIDTNSLAKGLKMNIPFDKKRDNLLEYQYRMIDIRAKGVKTNLKALATEYDIPFDEAKLHDGIYDLTINIQVWNKLKYQIEI